MTLSLSPTDWKSDPVSISTYLLTRLHVVSQDIDDMIKDEEDALEAYYQEVSAACDAMVICGNKPPVVETPSLEKDEPSSPSSSPSEREKETGFSTGFSPLINTCASEISEAFSNCWVSVRASRQNENNPEYVVSIQPDNHNTPNDIQLKLKSLGYAPTFKAIRDLESAVWADFEVQTNGLRPSAAVPSARRVVDQEGITFNLSSTVSAVDPPELGKFDTAWLSDGTNAKTKSCVGVCLPVPPADERYDEPATDEELPF